jgi:hypothetical protein
MSRIASGIENQDLHQVKQILFALNGTFKKLSLYFGNHSIYQNALNQLKKLLDDYLDTHGDLRFDLQRDAIRFGEEIVHDERLEPNELFYILFRDGILWLSFQAGLELWELDTFYRIVQKHMILEDTAEDDVVTALWEFDLHGITYEAADLDLGPVDILDDFDIRRRPDPDEFRPEDSPSSSAAENAALENQPQQLKMQDDIWQLTDHEREVLRKMVAVDERLDGTDYVTDVLIYILRQLNQPGKDIDELLDSLTRELREAALSGRFTYFWHVLKKIKLYQHDIETGQHWSAPYLQEFFKSLTAPAFLNVLTNVLFQVEDCEPEERTALKKALLLLDASAMLALAPLLLEIKNTQMYKLVLVTIGAMAVRNFSYMDRLLASDDSELVRRLAYLLGRLKDQPSRRALSRLLSHHSEAVRKEALKAILTRDPQSLRSVFGLIEDPDESVRTLLLHHLGKSRNLQAEKLLLEYLENKLPPYKKSDHLIPICQALGRCGSAESIAFLESELFKWPFLGVLRPRRSQRRQAAMAALRALNTPRAAELIAREARGFFGNIFRKL